MLRNGACQLHLLNFTVLRWILEMSILHTELLDAKILMKEKKLDAFFAELSEITELAARRNPQV